MIPKRFKLDASGDLDLTTGLTLTSTLAEYVAGALRSRFLFFAGEWFLDRREGLPYFRAVIVKNPDMALIHSIFARAAKSVAGVANVDRLTLSLNATLRKLTVSGRVSLANGETLTFIEQPYLIPLG